MMTDTQTEAPTPPHAGPTGFPTRPSAALVDLASREAAVAAAEYVLAYLDGRFWEPIADRNTVDVDLVGPLVLDLENVLWLAVDVLAGRDPCARGESVQALADHHAACRDGERESGHGR